MRNSRTRSKQEDAATSGQAARLMMSDNRGVDEHMTRILILSGFKIFPNVTGGHLRSGTVARSLARLGNEVCIYSLAGRKSDYGRRQDIIHQVIEENLVEEVNLSLSIGLIQSLSRRLGLPRIWQYLLLSLGLIPESLRARLRWADVIICDLPYTPPVPGVYRRKTWLLLSHNLEHRLLAQGSLVERFFAPWMKRRELAVPERFDGVLACATEDAEFFRNLSPNPEQVRLVANGIDPENYVRPPAESRSIREGLGLTDEDQLVVFSGSRFRPNLEALADLTNFCRKETDFLTRHRITFLILGSLCPSPRRTETMIMTGPVEETYPYFAAADAALNPVQGGSGSNVKTFEYVAAGLPLISTPFGARGTELVSGRDFMAFEDDETLKTSLANLVERRTKAEWKAHAAEVWKRVQQSCDMTAILRREWSALNLDKKPGASALLSVVDESA